MKNQKFENTKSIKAIFRQKASHKKLVFCERVNSILKLLFRTFFYSKMWELIFEHKEGIFGFRNFLAIFPTKKTQNNNTIFIEISEQIIIITE